MMLFGGDKGPPIRSTSDDPMCLTCKKAVISTPALVKVAHSIAALRHDTINLGLTHKRPVKLRF